MKCIICQADEPRTGTCGSNDPRALCNQVHAEHVHTVDCFVEGTQVCGMERQERPAGSFFDINQVPLLTDKQDQEARAGMCPSCHREGLVDVGTGEGLRFLGCVSCTAVVVLASRPDDRKLCIVTGRRFGRTYLAQQVKVAMRMRDESEGGPR